MGDEEFFCGLSEILGFGCVVKGPELVEVEHKTAPLLLAGSKSLGLSGKITSTYG
ncbi:hypothetical protein SBDP1_500038 [Syntrophobacter sp. SbD1]|nr:hypothetical protein SBDP1_500038 [Syntrophobacter sp. SbD1]